MFDGEMVDRHRVGIESDGRRQPVEPAGTVEAEGEFGFVDRHIRGA